MTEMREKKVKRKQHGTINDKMMQTLIYLKDHVYDADSCWCPIENVPRSRVCFLEKRVKNKYSHKLRDSK